MSNLIGQVLDDRYRVIERVGEGAMGSVYRAVHTTLERLLPVLPIDSNRGYLEG